MCSMLGRPSAPLRGLVSWRPAPYAITMVWRGAEMEHVADQFGRGGGEIASRNWARTPQNTMNLRNILHGPISYIRIRTRS